MEQTTESLPPQRHIFYTTYILMVVNIGAYLLLLQSGGPTYENLMVFGAKENGLIAEGEVHRLLIPIFLHGNHLHILLNMVALFQVGRALESLVGARNLALLYIISGVVGNLCSFAFSDKLSVGASSSLFGLLMALYVIQKYEERLAEEDQITLPPSGLGALLLVQAVISVIIPRVDWASHLGGSIGGLFIGLGLVMRHRWNRRLMAAYRYVGQYGLPRPTFLERESTYYFILAIIAVSFGATVVSVDMAARAFGLGVQKAAIHYKSAAHPEPGPHSRMLFKPTSVTSPQHLREAAEDLHTAGQFGAAISLYESLKLIQNLPSELKSGLNFPMEDIVTLQRAAENGQIPENSTSAPRSTQEAGLEVCRKAGSSYKAFSLFAVSARLYECAWHLSGTKEDAAEAFESYWMAEDLQGMETFQKTMRRQSPRTQNLASPQ